MYLVTQGQLLTLHNVSEDFFGINNEAIMQQHGKAAGPYIHDNLNFNENYIDKAAITIMYYVV